MKKKVYKAVVGIMLFSLLLQLCGCKNEQQKKNSNEVVPEQTENSDIEITKEYLCSEFGIDESEFEGVDLEDFLIYYDLTYETLHKDRLIGYLLKRYKEDCGKVRIPDYMEKFVCKREVQLTKENQDDIAIVIFRNSNLPDYAYIFDFEIGKIISGSSSLSHKTDEDIVGNADEIVKQSIITLFEKYDVYSWEQGEIYYAPNTLVSEGIWEFEILFSDDTIYWLYGENLNDKTAPESLDLFLEDLKALAPDSEE